MDCYIVTLACSMDDFVLAVVEDLETARWMASKLDSNQVPRQVSDVYGMDASEVLYVKAVHVVDGLPQSVEVIRDFTVEAKP
jgi:hypothetical protein